MAQTHTPLLIIGSGPAGYTAAIYAARAMLKPILIAGEQKGGQLTITTDVENYPGYADPVQGPWMMEQMHAQAENVGAELVTDHVARLHLDERPFRAECNSGDVYTADAVVLCTGAQAKWLGLESEKKYSGFGVSACATCDGFFYKERDVIVVGGGNTAVEEALYLSGIARSVTLVHRRDELRAERILQERLFAKENVDILWNTELAEVKGTEGLMKSVEAAVLRDREGGETSERPIDGIFIAIGHAPAVELVKDTLKLRDSGYLWTAPDSTRTSREGVFAAGDVTDDIYRQAVTAAGQGCMAALEAEKYLAALETGVMLEAAE